MIDESAVPLSAGCTIREALGDGEDFEMLLAIDVERVAGLLEGWREAFPELSLTVIGRLVRAGEGSSLDGGWEHFAIR